MRVLSDKIRKCIRSPAVTYSSLTYRAFNRSDFQISDDGLVSGGPDFIFVGLGKCGTSFLYRCLMTHPMVAKNRLHQKELGYFSHLEVVPTPEQIEIYLDAFKRPPGKICGEASLGYLTETPMPDLIASVAPDTKIIVTLRNPVDYFVSWLNHTLSEAPPLAIRKSTEEIRFTERIWLPFAVHMWEKIPEQIGKLRMLFPVKVIQHEALERQPELVIQDLYRFLNIDATHVSAALGKRVNTKPYLLDKPDREKRARLAARFAHVVPAISEACPELDLRMWQDFTL